MLTSSDIESLIAVKRREIEKEKSHLGLSPPTQGYTPREDKENAQKRSTKKKVKFAESRVLCERNDTKDEEEKNCGEQHKEPEDFIPPDLERYIRRYIGLPVMLKAGEYSPNNPLVRGERAPGDVLLGLGEYERRRNTLRKIRQQQYREYLDQQAKKKQEAKEQAERERREREQREREREERERELVEERDKYSPNRRRSVQQLQSSQSVQNLHRDHHMQLVPLSAATTKVDTGVQVDGFSQPLSVAVQTDDSELFSVPSSPLLCQLTTAERELSPRTALVCDTSHHEQPRRRSYGDFDERSCLLKKCSRSRLSSDLRHTYMPSIFDADAIRLRNLQAEKEAAERRQFYQQELKDQILEQQRIREERKNREKMLEQAEMRRLEEQLRMLRLAQERERGRQHDIAVTMKENATEYQNKRSELQREIDLEQQKLLRASSQPNRSIQRHTNTSKSDTAPSKLPFYYPKIYEQTNEIQKKPYTINIPDNSIFSSNYDVDSYLRKNLNFNKNKDYFHSNVEIKEITPEKKLHVPKNDTYEKNEETTQDKKIHVLRSDTYGKSEENAVEKKLHVSKNEQSDENTHENNLHVSSNKNIEEKSNIIVEKALIHEKPDSRPKNLEIPSKNIECIDTLPIPVLRHSPTLKNVSNDNIKMSEAMKKVDDKWKVPAIQKNILKSLPNDEGKNVNILTQLGSIRRQLQLEQLKLDKMLSKDDDV